jgi:hypothetical protein
MPRPQLGRALMARLGGRQGPLHFLPAIEHWGGKADEIVSLPDGRRRLSMPHC